MSNRAKAGRAPPHYLSRRSSRDIVWAKLNYSSANIVYTDPVKYDKTQTVGSSSLIPESAKFYPPDCQFDEHCKDLSSNCDVVGRVCHCPLGYMSLLEHSGPPGGPLDSGHLSDQRPLVSSSSLASSSRTVCLQPSLLFDICTFDGQCIVTNSHCPRNYHSDSSCRCRKGFTLRDGLERYNVDGQEIVAKTVCRLDDHGKSEGFVAMVIIIGLLSLVALIACLVGLIRLRKKKQQRGDTMTGVVSDQNGGQGQGQDGGQQQPNEGNNYQGMSFQPGQQYMTSTGQIVIARSDGTLVPAQAAPTGQPLSSFPGPAGHPALGPGLPGRSNVVMGSAQAEFQNDFIEVFPMHHLEPCPDKNMSSLGMQ
ncbi:hypothetical protein HDE_13253 [Halotydeus destructor]|nr:hypothetical protein HDE_13253 [Halotydeus destructor]